MLKHVTHLIFLVLALAVVTAGTAYGKYNPLGDEALIGWWACDEGQGDLVADSSANGNDGTAYDGDLIWGPGVYGNAIELADPVLVEVPAINQTLTECTMAGWIKRNGSQSDWASFIMTRGTATGFNLVSNQLAYHWNDTSESWSARPAAPVPDGEWTFCAVTIEPDIATFYINGVEMDTNEITHAESNWNANIYLGGDSTYTGSRRLTDAWLDDVSLFSRALTAEEVADIMKGLSDPVLALAPSPMNEATDVPRDDDLSWRAGEGATSHDVYFGTVLADVEAGDASVLISQGQSGTTLDPGRLEFGATYYWRVDEHNSEGVATGDIWTFTVEPITYAIENITVTANTASDPGAEPELMLDGSGLNAADQHSVDAADMWLGDATGLDAVVLEFAFDQAYKLDEMLVWNYNVLFELMLGFGVKDATIEYSADGVEWTALGDFEFAQATAKATYTANTTIDFGGVAVQYVRLTVSSNFGGMAKYGLSEVRFMYVPAQAREPQPDDGDTNIVPDTMLSWRAGREAATHELYLSASAEAVLDGTALVETTADTSYATAPLGLEFGTTYYWKVNEVNEAEAISTWVGNLWSFSIEEYATIDDFEAYTDEDGGRIYETWIDGWVNATGSTVGYATEPFAEGSVVNSGQQSMPLQYDNSYAPYYSEAEREFGGADWDTNGADRLVVHYRGNAVGFVENADGTITIGAGGADIYSGSDEGRYVYKQLNGDGTIIARVDSIYNSDPWAKGGVMIRENIVDNSPYAMVVVTPESGVAFQRRTTSGGDGANTATAGLTAPHWVKLTRTGDTFTAQESADGVTWVDIDEVEIELTTNLFVGLVLTSHNETVMTSADFSNVSITGNVTGEWKVQELGVEQPVNDPDQIYLVVEDTSGGTAVVTYPDAEATLAPDWVTWEIPFTDLSGVNLNSVATLYVGIGDRANPTAGGVGTLYVDDIEFGRPAAVPADVTAPGDAVQGVPNDGDWPPAETPDLAIDDDVNTKYLHFKGDFDPDAGPTGLQVTPAMGATVVTGLTFTTANDVPGRDPTAFELYGSKDSIDGPYTLIASGDIADFAGATEWERFTKTSTEISFDNVMAYSHYQVLFTDIRGPVGDSVNSMQIAEIELLGVVAP